MKMWTKRVWALLLAVAMMLSFCACSPADDDDEGNQSGSGGWWDSLTSVYPEEEIVEITILAQEYADPGYPRKWSQEGMALVRKIAYERFGLKLKLQEVIGGADNFKTILNTQFASNSEVADVIRFDLDLSELNQHYLKGKILNLSDYAQYMPDVVSTFDEIPSLYQSNCTPEGDILRIPTIAYNVQHVSNWANIRRDWLDALNLESPTTTEEFRTVLRAFQQNDMNGNGKADEVFIAGYGQLNNVLSEALLVRHGMAGFIDAAVYRAPEVFDKGTVDSGINSRNNEIPVQRHRCPLHACTLLCLSLNRQPYACLRLI